MSGHSWLPQLPTERKNIFYEDLRSIPTLPKDLTDSFGVPTGQECVEASPVLAHITSDLEECWELLAYVKQAEETLRVREEAYLQAQFEYQSLNAPIRRLPAEVMVEIFKECHEHRHVCSNTIRVCKQWKTWADKSTYFWVVPPWDSEDTRGPLRAWLKGCNAYIRHCKTFKIRWSFNPSYGTESQERVPYSGAEEQNVLLETMSRAESLCLDVGDSESAAELIYLLLAQGNYATLEHLGFEDWSGKPSISLLPDRYSSLRSLHNGHVPAIRIQNCISSFSTRKTEHILPELFQLHCATASGLVSHPILVSVVLQT